MDILSGIWNDPAVLAKMMFSVLVTIGVMKGIITIPWIKVKLKNKKKKGNGNKIEDHEDCEFFPGMQFIVDKAVDRAIDVYHIRTHESLDDLMVLAEEFIEKILDDFEDAYYDLYESENGGHIDGLQQKRDIRQFRLILESMEPKLKGMTRRFMKENHFDEKTEAEFREYIKERTAKYRKKVTKKLNYGYISSDFKINRDTLFKYNLKHVFPRVEKDIEDFFYKAREISIHHKKQIKKIQERII